LGRKVSDEFTVPICRLHHRELHNPFTLDKAAYQPVRLKETLCKDPVRCTNAARRKIGPTTERRTKGRYPRKYLKPPTGETLKKSIANAQAT
jgi:hypothetical protein